MSVTAAQAIENFKNDPGGPAQAVVDSAADVAGLLDGLEPLAAAGALQSVAFTDPTPPTLALDARQLASDAGVIAKFYFSSNRFVYVSAVSANGIPVGNDSTGNGSATAPFATIARAENGLAPGQTLLLNGLANRPTAYAGASLTVGNTAIDSVQPYGASIVASGANDDVLTVDPSAGGTITLGRVIVDGGDRTATDMNLATAPSGPYSVIFNGTDIENFTGFGVVGEAANVSATFAGANISSQDGVTAAIYFDHMASGALSVGSTTINVKQALTSYGAGVTAYATAAGPSVRVANSDIVVTSVTGGTQSGDFHYGIRLANVHGAVIEGDNVTIDSAAAPGWGAKPIAISTTLDESALNSGDFVVAGNTVYGDTSLGMIGIAIGEEGDEAATRGLLDGGVIWGNSVSSSPAAQMAGAHGIFVGSEADTAVYGNTVEGVGIGLVDKNGDDAVYYANTVSDCTFADVLLKGSTDATVVENNLFTSARPYDAYGIHVTTNPDTGHGTTGAIVSGNTVVATGATAPHFASTLSGEDATFSDDVYVSTTAPGEASWVWKGQALSSYAAWQAASGELGGGYTQGSSDGGALNPYPLPIGAPPALTPSGKSSLFGLSVGGVTAANALSMAEAASVTRVAVVDDAANVEVGLNALEAVANAGELASITLTDSSPPTLTLLASELIEDTAAVEAIGGAFNLNPTGGVTALQAIRLPEEILAHVAGGLAVVDDSADVTAFLDELQPLAVAGRMRSLYLTVAGGSTVAITASQLIDDASVLSSIQYRHHLLLAGPIANSGSVSLDAGGPTILEVAAAGVSLTGGGAFDMGLTGANSILGATSGATLTNVDNTITGAGDIGDFVLRLVNKAAGVIDADAAAALTLAPGAGATIVNQGRIEATGAGGLTVSSCVVDDLGGGIMAAAGGAVDLHGARIIGGVLEASGAGRFHAQSGVNTLDGTQAALDNQATVIVDNGVTTMLEGAIANTGVVELNGTGSVTTLEIGSANVSLSGGGRLLLGAGAQDRVIGATAAATLTNVDNTISGSGALGGRRMTLDNEAAGLIYCAIDAMTIDTGAATVANAGKIETLGSGVLTIDSALANNGVLDAGAGALTVKGAVTGGGHAVILGGTLVLGSNFSQSVAFGAIGGVLELARSQSYGGVVSGFSTSGTSSLDLLDIAFVGGSEASYSGGQTQGLLTVSDGTHTARIALRGDYAGSSFVSASDGHGGTLITDAAGPMVARVQLFAAAAASLGASVGPAPTAPSHGAVVLAPLLSPGR